MKKKCLFSSIAGVMLLGAFCLTSCVQDDMYELYDDGFESGFVRMKKGKDFGGSNSNFEAEYQRRKQWVNDSTTMGADECVACAIVNSTGRNIVDVRNEIGQWVVYGTYGVGNNWEYYYYMAVNGGGGISSVGSTALLSLETGTSEWTISEWNQYAYSMIDQNTGVLNPDREYIVQLEGRHWGILKQVYYDPQPGKDNKFVVVLKDQFGEQAYRNRITKIYTR